MLMEITSASDVVTTAITSLSGQVTTVIPAALGVAVLVFGAKYLWRTVKGLVR